MSVEYYSKLVFIILFISGVIGRLRYFPVRKIGLFYLGSRRVKYHTNDTFTAKDIFAVIYMIMRSYIIKILLVHHILF